jgi:hypothetical protein
MMAIATLETQQRNHAFPYRKVAAPPAPSVALSVPFSDLVPDPAAVLTWQFTVLRTGDRTGAIAWAGPSRRAARRSRRASSSAASTRRARCRSPPGRPAGRAASRPRPWASPRRPVRDPGAAQPERLHPRLARLGAAAPAGQGDPGAGPGVRGVPRHIVDGRRRHPRPSRHRHPQQRPRHLPRRIAGDVGSSGRANPIVAGGHLGRAAQRHSRLRGRRDQQALSRSPRWRAPRRRPTRRDGWRSRPR